MSDRSRVFIYGIRVVGTDAIVYVGSTFDYKLRRKSGYNSALTSFLDGKIWEYVTLESASIGRAHDAEIRWLEHFKKSGNSLFNISHPAWIDRKRKKSVVLSVTVSADLAKAVKRLAKSNKVTVTSLARLALLDLCGPPNERGARGKGYLP